MSLNSDTHDVGHFCTLVLLRSGSPPCPNRKMGTVEDEDPVGTLRLETAVRMNT